MPDSTRSSGPAAAIAAFIAALAAFFALNASLERATTVTGPAGLDAEIGRTPLAFEPNAGRASDEVDFIAHSVAGGSLYLGSDGATLALPQPGHDPAALRLGFAGADPDATVHGVGELAGKANSFIGDDPSAWRSGIPTYERVRYERVYPGIDLDFYGNQSDLEYDFRIAPHAHPRDIAVNLRRAGSLRVAPNGDLLIEVGRTTIRQRAPVAYQEIDGERRPVSAAYELDGSTVGFGLGDYDHSLPLVIDPLVLAYSTYLGGGGSDGANAIAIDSSGAAYVAGETFGADFPTQDPFQTNQGTGDFDAFVAKFDPDTGGALTLAYSTYLAGTGSESDFANGIAVDPTGAAYVTGGTLSTDFPTDDQFMGDPGDMSGEPS